jgi:protease I
MPDSKKIAFLIAPEGTERVELTEPWDAVEDAGHEPALLSTADGEAQLFNHLDRAETVAIDGRVQDASPDDYDAIGFVLALDDYDLGRMQPHPPGYPVYVALGRAAHVLVGSPLAAATLVSAVSAAVTAVALWWAVERVASGTSATSSRRAACAC